MLKKKAIQLLDGATSVFSMQRPFVLFKASVAQIVTVRLMMGLNFNVILVQAGNSVFQH